MREAGLSSPFLACDIRGPYPGAVDETLFTAVGRALAAQWPAGDTVLLAGDVRHSTASLIAALALGMEGLALTPAWPMATPLAYFVSQRHGFAHTLIVTASHNPPEHNGLKLLNGVRPPTTEEILRLRDATELQVRPDCGRTIPTLSTADTTTWAEAYGRTLAALAPAARPLRLVVDPGNGCYCGLAAAVLREAGHYVLEINGTPDGAFPGRGPDPTAPGALVGLAEAVRCHGSDLGVGFDGDGDRAVFVDERGRRVPGDAAAFLLASEAWQLSPSAPVVLDVRTSRSLARLLTDRGAEVVWSYPGHALVRAEMQNRGASFGGEISGHYFFRELGNDDGLYAALRVGALVAATQPLGMLVDALPRSPGLDEIRVPYEGNPETVYDALEKAYLGALIERGPLGMALTWDRAWALVRPSITERLLTVRAEADTSDELARLRALLRTALAAANVNLE